MLVTARDNEVFSPSEENDLIKAVRAGDLDAYGLIYRSHAAAALSCALSHCRSRCAAEDVRAEAFTAMLAAIRAGRGPRGPVLPYLRTAIRRIAAEWRRRDARIFAAGDGRDFEVSHLDTDTSLAHTELSIVAEAFMTLPDRWREVLRHTVIEAEGPARLCALFGVNAAAVAALAYRAREGLRETYLQAHIRHLVDDACRLHAEQLGAYTRGRAGRSQRRRIEDHLAACASCAKLSAMLCCINSTIVRKRAPYRQRTR
jgi:RNA polymerase sigma factor (sigma-70 family)